MKVVKAANPPAIAESRGDNAIVDGYHPFFLSRVPLIRTLTVYNTSGVLASVR
ncbi:MAG: hypothetical protein PWP41_1794 [Moorella sp. (in: firmicutes)]|uniref:Uncharacterized protein n=1 Tax=Neomoorella thermoacetica TaxID=1525 RepID=A0A1J5NIH0_NEOTH|nr:hypothetical protein [Moorella sp. (in: firmicutes)]OIQ58358.1 hypothetical protein MOTE_20210 [Moorella thermoacetica]